MDLTQLSYFRTVARLESITQAAEELHIAQPSLSMTIARLEQDLGVPLFDRYGRRIHLNRFGKAFLARVKRILNELDQGVQELADMAGNADGEIRIGATSSQFLPDLLSEYLKAHPKSKFQLLHVSGKLDIPKRLISGDFDLCLSSLPLAVSRKTPTVCHLPLMSEPIWLAVPEHHPLASRQAIAPKDLAGEVFIGPSREDGLRAIIDGFCQAHHLDLNLVMEANDPAVICHMVRNGLGLAFLPQSWLSSTQALPFTLHPLRPTFQRQLWLAWVQDRYLPAAVTTCRDFMIQYFKHRQEPQNMSRPLR